MRCLGASGAVLAAAMTISLTPLGQTARASDDKPVIRSTIERNTILPFSANPYYAGTYNIEIERYGAPTLLLDLAEFHECTDVTEGVWTYTDTQDCGKEKCGNEWTAHNNQRITDTFTATWTSPDNTLQWTFNITVPVVRPDHEETVFERWSPDFPTAGEWKQKLVPPSSDPTFDFSGEHVQEAVGGGGHDGCYFSDSKIPYVGSITGGRRTGG